MLGIVQIAQRRESDGIVKGPMGNDAAISTIVFHFSVFAKVDVLLNRINPREIELENCLGLGHHSEEKSSSLDRCREYCS
ncbi:hypothetical protein [Devosia sp.]|uniref:hypothetical protein n=1 Tax=Devosia sp. TaxID=1871048 RepID=UPI001AC85C1D|nr:hypothetical protein [Devosia sp.]MBN9332204.1 hypothetical protein [Devosia sp.]